MRRRTRGGRGGGLTGVAEVQQRLLEGDLRGRHADEEAEPVEGAQVQVLRAGVGDGTHVGEELPGHGQLDGTHRAPLHVVLCEHTHTHTRVLTHTHTHTKTCTRAQTHAHTHTHRHAHDTSIHTRTRAHKRTQTLYLWPVEKSPHLSRCPYLWGWGCQSPWG